MKRLCLIFIFIYTMSISYAQNNEALADSYFKKGEFKKALVIYQGLLNEKPHVTNFLYKVVKTYQQMEAYVEAEQLLIEKLNTYRRPVLLVELGYNYQLRDSIVQAKALYNEAITVIETNPNYIFSIARKFEDHSLLEEAIEVYNKGKTLAPDKNFSIQLARIYGEQGNIEQMFANYIDYIAYRPNYLNNIKRAISDFISEDRNNENNRFLRKLLLIKIQEEPNSYWYEMLSWLYIQERAYQKSFVQEKALYKRNPESLDRIIELALTALDDDADETAKAIFNFVLEISQDGPTILTAHEYILQIDTKNAGAKDLQRIDGEYKSLFEAYGKSDLTLSLQLAYGEFLAFYLNQEEKANIFLKEALELNISNYQKARVKLLLGDILVLQERFNEALIYYSQIQVNLKNSTISQEARFKVAKTSYYKGDFDWAESQLKILKSSTSQLIANDALDLKLLISDNKYEDSTQTALKYYAKADLLAFQNKANEAIELLDKVLTEHKGESIIDQALFRQAKLYEKENMFLKAEVNYLEIIKDYSQDILADDAIYHLAELYSSELSNPEEAKALYERILFEFEDSIYFIESRKKFRQLRGDNIN